MLHHMVLHKQNSISPGGGKPFYDREEIEADAGLDAKIGVTNNLTMDLTLNPDFGQVEADP